MKNFSRFLLILACVSVLYAFEGVVAAAAAPSGQIAVINMQKVMRKSSAGQKAMEQLNKTFETLQKDLQQRQEELKTFKDDLEKKAPLMSEEARAEKEREYKKMVRDYKELNDDAQYEMRQEESKIMEPILKDLEKVVTALGEKAGYTLILENNMPGIYYVAPQVDITEEVITLYDQQSGSSAQPAE